MNIHNINNDWYIRFDNIFVFLFLRHQYEQEKREKLKSIAKQYLNDPNFPESRALLSFKEEMEEELSLIDRFHAFSKRIQDLQQEVLYLRQVNKNEI